MFTWKINWVADFEIERLFIKIKANAKKIRITSNTIKVI